MRFCSSLLDEKNTRKTASVAGTKSGNLAIR